jgi:hypothetical protein
MDYHWKIYLVGQSSSFIEKYGDKLTIMEAIVNQNCGYGHVYFEFPKGNNDLNIINKKPFDWS